MSTTPNLLIQHIATSQNSKEVTANSAFDDLDGALTGTYSQAMADADQTPTASDCYYNAVFLFTGALTAVRKFVVPTSKKFYLVKNNTTGGYNVNVTTAAGTGILISANMGYVLLYADGVNVQQVAYFGSGNGKRAQADLLAQGAAITPTTIYAVPTGDGGMYRISWAAKVTTDDTVSSTLGGTNGFQVVYTDSDDSVVVTTPAGATSSGNTTGTQLSGEIDVYAKAGTNIQFSFDYATSGVVSSVPMAYSLHVRVSKI